MDIARSSIERPLKTWIIVAVCLLGGLWGQHTIGQLEDPAFTIKSAIVVTAYPGASAREVEEEVTERLESAIQQLGAVEKVTSKSRPGVSEITVELKPTVTGKNIPQAWDELRRKVNDAQRLLPSGVATSLVNDDYGDVYGIFYAVTAVGFSDRETREIGRFLRRDLLTIEGVAKVSLAGEPMETIYIELPKERLLTLGIPVDRLPSLIQVENAVFESGRITIDDRRIRIETPEGFSDLAGLESIRVGVPGSTEQVFLSDIGMIERQRTEIPSSIIRHDGVPAFTLAISGVPDANIVDVGRAVDARLAELAPLLPLGVEMHPIYQQHILVDQSMTGFIANLIMSVSIVILVLCLFMGWRVGIVVGATLGLTVFGTLFMMRVGNLEMQRISLGALIIAMGMLVDNAIVVAEGMLINIQKGMRSVDAAADAAKRTQIPLLAATVIGIMAFAGIGLSNDSTGEFLFSLFAVIAISLLLSWFLAVTVTPLFGYYLLRSVGKNASGADDLYGSFSYRAYRSILGGTLRHQWLVVFILGAITVGSMAGFAHVRQSFFPESNTPIFFIDYFLPQGTDIRTTARDVEQIESIIRRAPGVEAVTSFVGQGANRFTLTYSPEQPNSAFGHFIVQTSDSKVIGELAESFENEIGRRFPDSEVRTKRIAFGPGGGPKVEVRFSGKDPVVLRALAEEARVVMAGTPELVNIRNNWRQREMVLTPIIEEERARVAGITRQDIATALKFGTEGITVGVYREGIEQLPIVARLPDYDRLNYARIVDRMVWSPAEQSFVPLTQVVQRIAAVSEDTLIHRRNRQRTMAVQADLAKGVTAAEARGQIVEAFEAIHLPPGYTMEWGGEYESSRDARKALGAQLPASFLIMLVITLLLFGTVRQTIVVWLVVPMAVSGVVIGLLATNQAFTFTALLGLLSLSGMLLKNGIVLVDEIAVQIREGKEALVGVLDASVSRLRPVVLAAATTILGMLPLLMDAFFVSMAITIMAGLAFATVLTLVAVPTLYCVFYRIKGAPKKPKQAKGARKKFFAGKRKSADAQSKTEEGSA